MTDELFSVAGKSVVLTGACGVIGRTLAQELCERSARLVLNDIDEASLAKLSNQLDGDLLIEPGNVADATVVSRIQEHTVERFGRADVLINCHQYKPAGFLTAKAETFPEDLWDSIIEANLKGTFLTCREFGRQMLAQGSGSIVNLASTYGVVSSNPALYDANALGNPVAYSASKGGVIMLTKYLGAHWAANGVRVNCVTPHGVANQHEQTFVDRFSSMSPMGRLMEPNEVVGAVIYLASDASKYSTGANILVEGGWTAW